MQKALAVFLVSLALLPACASNPSIATLSSSQRARLSNIDIVKGPIARPFSILRPVQGISCHRNAYQQQLVTENEAIEGVRIKAALLDADAVMNVSCQTNTSGHLVNNCFVSIVCVGDAIKYTQ